MYTQTFCQAYVTRDSHGVQDKVSTFFPPCKSNDCSLQGTKAMICLLDARLICYFQVYDTKVLAKALGVEDEKGDTNLEGLFKV